MQQARHVLHLPSPLEERLFEPHLSWLHLNHRSRRVPDHAICTAVELEWGISPGPTRFQARGVCEVQ